MKILETILVVEVLAVGLSALFLVPIVLVLWVMPLTAKPTASMLFTAAAWGGTVITLGAVLELSLS